MQLYRWRAISSGGKIHKGQYFAEDEAQVVHFVHANYGFVTEIKTVEERESLLTCFNLRRNFSNQERAIFFRQLYTLLEAGISIVKAVEMATSRLSEKYKPVCRQLTTGLCSGQPLSQALKFQPEYFSKMAVAVVAAGEASGQLNQVLKALADFYQQQDKMIKFARNVCVYPAFLLVLSFFTLLFFSVKLLPMFADLYQSLGVKETDSLRFLLFYADFLHEHTVALSCVLLIVGKVILAYRKKLISLLWDLPGLKNIRHTFLEVRFEKLMALLLQSGIPLPEAIIHSSAAVEDEAFQEQAKAFSESVIRGIGIAEAASQAEGIFSDLSIEFLQVGEHSGNLPAMLAESARVQEQDLFAQLRDLKAVVEPALILLIATVIFGVIILIMAPLFSLMTNLPEYS